MQNSNTLSNQSSEMTSPTNNKNPLGAIKVEKQGSFTESASSPSAKKLVNPELELNDPKRRIVTSAFEAAVIKVKSSIFMQNYDNAPSSFSSCAE